MFKNSNLTKSSSIAAAGLIFATAILPTGVASAHDRHNPAAHYGQGHHLTKHQHRQFHDRYGRGHRGTQNYYAQQRKQHHHQKHVTRKNKKGELIAAGIIGLAVGAIIASEASKRKHRSHQPTYYQSPPQRPAPRQPTYDPAYDNKNASRHWKDYNPVPLDEYNSGDPNVITFNEPASLEPWTPGWREWCQNRYRSFNPSTGTFRGYDGLDHFCVPK